MGAYLMRAMVSFGEFTPDQPGPKGGLESAVNVYPVANGYAPVPGFSAITTEALPGWPLGAAGFRGGDRLSTILAGTADGLYRRDGTGWTSIGTGFSGSFANPWVFEQFGVRAIATNGIDAPVWYDLSGSVPAVTVLSGAPKMRFLVVVLDFLVGGVIDGDSTVVQWSGRNNSEEWRPGFGRSDINIATSGGAITGLVGGEYGLVLQEERVVRMRFVGGNVIFQFDPITQEIGCIAPRSVVALGRISFWLSQRGFVMCDGANVTPIGDEKIDRTFLAASAAGRLNYMSVAVDPVRKLVKWTLPADDPNTIYAYSWTLRRWTTINTPARLLFGSRSSDTTIGEDTAPLPDDELLGSGVPFGDESNLGGALSLALFNASNQAGEFAGGNLSARLQVGDVELVEGRTTRLRRTRPITDAPGGVTVEITGRRRYNDALTTTSHSGFGRLGDVVTRREVRSMRPALVVAADTEWTFAQGFDFDFSPGVVA